MNITKHTILVLLALAAMLLAACSDEEAVTMPGTEAPDASGLRIALSLGGKQPLYRAAETEQTRANTIEGENSLNENTVSTVDFFLFSPEMEEVEGVKQVKTDSNGDTVWVRTFYGRHNVSRQPMTDDDTNDQSPDAAGNAVTPDYYPTDTLEIAKGSSTTWIESLGLVPGSRLYALANVDWTKAALPVESESADGAKQITYTAATATDITTIDELKSLSLLDTDIYKKEKAGETADTQETSGKRFLMDGCYRFTQADISAYQAAPNTVHEETVSLRRAAAKVRVNIYKATTWTYTYTDANGATQKANVSIDEDVIEAKVSNYATRTKAFAPETGEEPGDGSHVSAYASLGTYDRPASELTVPSGKEYLTSVLFYTFAHDWSDNIGHETTFIMNLPYTIPTGATESPRPNNWYKIVFVPDGGQRYHRNTFYEVDITVAYDGSEESYEPRPISNPEYKVSEWYPEEFCVENTTPVDYLILDKYFIDLRNEAETQITFYSSNKVTVEVVHDVAEEIKALKAAGESFPWPEGFESEKEYIGDSIDTDMEADIDGVSVANIPGIYYPDKENRRVPIYTPEAGKNTNILSELSYYDDNTHVADGTAVFRDLNRAWYKPVTVKADGNYESDKEKSEVYVTWPGNRHSEKGEIIRIYSAIPRNVTLRFITLKVTMEKAYDPGEYITRYVIIKQYPLEYIVNQFGFYSFMDANVLNKDGVDAQHKYESTFDNHVNGSNYQLYCGDLEIPTGAVFTKTVTVPSQVVNGVGEAADGYGMSGHVSANVSMKCKFYLDGTSKTYSDGFAGAYAQHTWRDAEGTHHGVIYQIDDSYDENASGRTSTTDNIHGLDANTPSNNNRMYEVTITATSSKYRIGYPMTSTWTDENGKSQLYAINTEENNQLVSPHFVIASQLGNSSATPYWETAFDQCMHYVEVDNEGNVFEDWRLPTIAELSIIKQYQLDDNVFNVTMNRILNSDGDTNPWYWTAGRNQYVVTKGEGTAETYTNFTDNETLTVVSGMYKGTTIKKAIDGDNKLAIRVRCVRDIKN